MSFYFNIVNLNKGHIKEVCYLQDIVNKSMLKEDHYFPTDAKTIKKALKQDAIFLGVYANKDLIAASLVFKDGLFFGRPLWEWMLISGNKIACHEFVIVHPDYRGQRLQKRLMAASTIKAKELGYDTMWCCCHPDNIYSRKNIEEDGYEQVADFVVDGWPRSVYRKTI